MFPHNSIERVSAFSPFFYAESWADFRCYVDAECATGISTGLFNGSLLYYSYDTCGHAPDCYNNFETDSRCPYDPHGNGSYMIFKSSGCECLYHGSELPSSLYTNFPEHIPGQYESLGNEEREKGSRCDNVQNPSQSPRVLSLGVKGRLVNNAVMEKT